MADKKISQLTAAATPLAGTEVLPIVQSGSTKQVSIADLTAGRAITTTGVNDASGNEVLKFTSVASAVNELSISNASNTFPTLSATGDGTNINIHLKPKGTGDVFVTPGTPDANLGTPSGSVLSIRSGAYLTGGTAALQLSGGFGDIGNAGAINIKATGSGGQAANDLIITSQTAFTNAETTRATMSGSTGDFTLSTGNLVIGTAGKGIDFSATADGTTMTSELLSDYEEGTFTPYIRFGGATTGQSYSLQTGRYTKVGRVVHVQVQIIFSNKGSATGTATINLPFTAAEAGGSSAEYLVSVSYTGYPMTFWGVGDTAITMQYAPEAGGGSNMDQTNFINTSRVYMSFSYIV